MSDYLLCIYPVVIIILMLFGAKLAKKKTFHEDFLSLQNAKILQGIAALGVMLHHLTQSITNYGAVYKGPITEFNWFGVLFTSIFFFFSGYGLLKSYLTKPNYLKSFLGKRLPAVLIPFLCSNVVYFLTLGLYRGGITGVGNIILCLLGFPLINGNTWFLVEICILYMVFFLAYHYIKNEKNAFGAVCIAVAVLITGSLLLGHDHSATGGHWFMGEWWYNTTVLFLIGMLVAKKEKPLVDFSKKHYVWLLPTMLLVFYGLYHLTDFVTAIAGYYREWDGYPGYGEKALTLFVQGLTCIASTCCVLLLGMKVRIYNPVLTFIGKISLSLYVIHELFKQMVLAFHAPSDMLFFLLVFVYSFLAAVVFHSITQLLLKGWKKVTNIAQ